MKLYVEMDEIQFKMYQESTKKSKELKDYSSDELAAALLTVIQNEGGVVDSNESYDSIHIRFKKTTAAKITKNNFVITLMIEKYANR